MTITGVQHITNSPRHPSVTKRGYQHLPNIAAARIPHQMAHKWVLIRHSKSWWWLWDFIFFTLAARPLFSLGSVATATWEVFRLGLVAVAIPFFFRLFSISGIFQCRNSRMRSFPCRFSNSFSFRLFSISCMFLCHNSHIEVVLLAFGCFPTASFNSVAKAAWGVFCLVLAIPFFFGSFPTYRNIHSFG